VLTGSDPVLHAGAVDAAHAVAMEAFRRFWLADDRYAEPIPAPPLIPGQTPTLATPAGEPSGVPAPARPAVPRVAPPRTAPPVPVSPTAASPRRGPERSGQQPSGQRPVPKASQRPSSRVAWMIIPLVLVLALTALVGAVLLLGR
jgi:hypothetical protein